MSTIDLHFDGTTECRCRNGWFQLREGLINAYTDVPEVYVNLYSKRHSKMAPIFLCFHNPEELRTLICGLAKALAQLTEAPAPSAPRTWESLTTERSRLLARLREIEQAITDSYQEDIDHAL